MIFSPNDRFKVGVPGSVGLKPIGAIATKIEFDAKGCAVPVSALVRSQDAFQPKSGAQVDMEKSGYAKGLHCMRKEHKWENGY